MRAIRMIFRTISESVQNIFRHGWLSVSAILSITVTLLLTSALLIVTLNIQQATTVVAQGLTAHVYLKTEISETEGRKIGKELEKFNNVKAVEYSTKDQQLTSVLDGFDEAHKDLLEDYRNSNPLNDVLIITMENPDLFSQLESEINQKYKNKISSIDYQQQIANTVLPVFETIRRGAYFLILAVAFVAIILISNTIRITIVARRTEIGIMRLVAASNWYIRTPFIIEGVLLGIIGALIATGISVGAYYYYLPLITEKFSFGTSDVIVSVQTILQEVLLWTTIIGGVIGLIGSFFPVRKYLKK